MVKLLTTKQAAEILGVSAALLERDRCVGSRIPYVVVGTRSIRYRASDLEDFVNNNVRTSTSEVAQ